MVFIDDEKLWYTGPVFCGSGNAASEKPAGDRRVAETTHKKDWIVGSQVNRRFIVYLNALGVFSDYSMVYHSWFIVYRS